MSSAAAPLGPTTNASSRTLDVLLVEDNDADVELTRAAFEVTGLKFRPRTVRDGREALDCLFRRGRHASTSLPDLVFLDLNLPYVNGFEVLRQVKASDATKHVPIIVLTMSQSPEDVMRAYQLGAAAYLPKPVDFEEFVEVVRAIDRFWFRAVRYPGRTLLAPPRPTSGR